MDKNNLPISFYAEDVAFTLPDQEKIKQWIAQVIDEHKYALEELSYIFCSDEYLYQINVEYLDHDTYTDIITFNNSDIPDTIEGDIFISLDRVRDNATEMRIPFEEELHRVLIHGVLHLLGFNDHTSEEEALMREKEDMCISSLKQL